MKYSKIVLLAACIIGTAGIATAANATQSTQATEGRFRGPMHGHRGGHDLPLARLIQKLDLTDAQRQSVRSLLESAEPQRQALRERHRDAFKAGLTTLPDDPNYPALIQQRKELAAASIQQRADLNVQLYALLTPEQKAQIPELVEKMKERAKHRHGRMNGDGAGKTRL